MDTTLVIVLLSSLASNILLVIQAYLKKKSENKATIEDTSTIKWLEENVKIRFSEQLANINARLGKQNEKLKAGLSLSTQHKLNLKKWEIESLFEFNKRLTLWYSYLKNFNPFEFPKWNSKELEAAYTKLDALKEETITALADLELLNNDDTFLKVREDLFDAFSKQETLAFLARETYRMDAEEFQNKIGSERFVNEEADKLNNDFSNRIYERRIDYHLAIYNDHSSIKEPYRAYKECVYSIIQRIDQ